MRLPCLPPASPQRNASLSPPRFPRRPLRAAATRSDEARPIRGGTRLREHGAQAPAAGQCSSFRLAVSRRRCGLAVRSEFGYVNRAPAFSHYICDPAHASASNRKPWLILGFLGMRAKTMLAWYGKGAEPEELNDLLLLASTSCLIDQC